MKIDLTEILSGRKNPLDIDYSFDMNDVNQDECPLLPDDVVLNEKGIHVFGKVTDSNGYMTLKINVECHYKAPCARCLEDVDSVVEFYMERIIRSGNAVTDFSEHLDDDDEWDGITDDLLYINDFAVDPDYDIIEELTLSFPMYHLCSDDCEGLCPWCGKRIADKVCNCAEEHKNQKKIDPRMEKLKLLLEKEENT